MSKYQPRVIINNLEKYVPDNIIEQFFLTIKTGDIDKIRDFANKYKNKYNLIEKSSKGSPNESGKTPFHVVLELDDKVANNDTKLQIMKFLDQMDAPMDLPDIADVWPIHLAAALQSKKIINFFIDKKVSLDKKDSSNNTPLHYAIIGKEISCPRPVSIGSLVPAQKFDKLPLNVSLEKINNTLIKLINSKPELNSDLIHMINTIMEFPKMYIDDELYRNLQTEAITIFSDIALSTTFPSDLSGIAKTSGMTIQQNKLEQLIEKYYSLINNELFRGLTNPLNIIPNNKGWGPQIKIGPNATDIRPPNNLERIMDNNIEDLQDEITNEYKSIYDSVTNINNINLKTTIEVDTQNLVKNINEKFIDELIFCQDCEDSYFGEEITLTKMLFLLSWNNYIKNYPKFFAKKIIEFTKLVNKQVHDQLINHYILDPLNFPIFDVNVNGSPYDENDEDSGTFLFMNSLRHIIEQLNIHGIRIKLDDALLSIIEYYDPDQVPSPGTSTTRKNFNLGLNGCIANQIMELIAYSLDNRINNFMSEPYPFLTDFDNLLLDPPYKQFKKDFNILGSEFKSNNQNWFISLYNLILNIKPRANSARVINSVNAIIDDIFVFYDSSTLTSMNPTDNLTKFIIPMIPLAKAEDYPGGASPAPNSSFIDVTGTYSSIRASLFDATNDGRYLDPVYTYVKKLERKYNLYDLIRIMDYLGDYLASGDIYATSYPTICWYNIGKWMDYVDWLGNKDLDPIVGKVPGTTIAQAYPEYIFLYKILVVTAQNMIEDGITACIENLINMAKMNIATSGIANIGNSNFRQEFLDFKNLFEQFDDAVMYNILLPQSNLNQFTNVPGMFDEMKKNKWDYSNGLAKWYENYEKESVISNFLQFIDILHTNTNPTDYSFNYEKLDELRSNMLGILNYYNTSDKNKIESINKIIHSSIFRNVIRQYFGTFKQSDPKNPIPLTIKNSKNVMINYNIFTNDIELVDVFNYYMDNLKANSISSLFFLTEVYGYNFIIIKQRILKLISDLNKIFVIITDIITFVKNNMFYYIPQIFLPALVKQILITVKNIIDFHDFINMIGEQKTLYYSIIDTTISKNLAIMMLGDTLIELIGKIIETIYGKVIDILKYHNDMINFLNVLSAYQLSSAVPDVHGLAPVSYLFDMNLIPIEMIPDVYRDLNFQIIENILKLYRIPHMYYYGSLSDANNTNIQVFNHNDLSTVTIGNPINFTNYRNIISLEREGEIIDSPGPGENLQLNITANKTSATNFDFRIVETVYHDDGQWLNFYPTDPNNPYDPNSLKFMNAFIGYTANEYIINWLYGMPPSIKYFAGKYLKIRKQDIIAKTIQYIIDNSYLDPSDPNSTKNIMDTIRILGNETTYTELDDVKIFVVIGKLLDSLINKLLEYSIRQNISIWIYQFATSNSSYRNIAKAVNKTIDIIKEKDYTKLILNDINKDAINNLFVISPKYIDYKLTQIEPNPKNIKYSSKSLPSDIISYLYNINYYPSSNNYPNNKCYHINPIIASKLITGNTINSKNSDGNTPLHYAINMNHSELVELLISRGANPKGFTNFNGKTAYDTGLINMTNHIELTQGNKVINTINNFVIPFNDLMLARLKDEKYANNIIKNITIGIPIILIMFNHMIHLHLENYRYNFSIELKKSIRSLLKKYYGQNEQLYPIDLFQVDNSQEVEKIIEPEIPENRINNVIKEGNKKKIDFYEKQIKEINNQIDGLHKEKRQPIQDPEQVRLIDDIISRLEMSRSVIDAKITSLRPNTDVPVVDSVFVSAYMSAVNSIGTRVRDRNITITEFYNFAFGRIGRTKDLYISIWNNYFNKNLINAPSMIFPLLNGIINKLINSSRDGLIDAEKKSELNTIVDFYNIVHNYIETKESYPNNLEENPILREEFDQIIYLIDLILTPAMKNILLSQIYEGLKEMDGANTIIRDQESIMDELLLIHFNGQTIDSYLTNILPKLAIKYYTVIYYNNTDVDKKITSSNDLFLPFIQIVKTNKIIQVTDDSLVVKNLREYLIPFMANTYQNFIHHLTLAIYGYERYVLNTYQLGKILQSLI